ncbi:energy transducer TonB [Luteimonas sp. BDR2-5]|uniref:energy transducer TonB n=1 Tax=Proluteimonas luteida TaxID=2878685 RepID=UPI001E46D267|nr:energy transducer TonB [Luteimonas sp. BDR2-5]MCD9029074.1 energy transducer TonB [Luteimonas sp. BDR2-5]
MSSTNSTPVRQPWLRLAAGAGLALAMAACGRSDEAATSPAPTTPAAVQAEAAEEAAKVQEAADASIAALSVEQLREEAGRAYQESRLYSPAGESAMEYYLALREKQAGDAAASSALIDLLPVTVIATEQSRDRQDFAEARRLLGLIERADPAHPALDRLRTSIAEAEEQAARRAAQQLLTAEQEAQRQQQLQAERVQQQQAAQAAAAQALQAEQERAAQEAARQQAEREEAARRQAAEREEAARLEAERQRQAAQAPPPPAAPTPAQLQPISTPAPRYPADALRAGTSGEVQVEFTVGVDGSVTNARVVRADPPRTFDREALAAVRRWRFEPVAAPVTTRRTIGFSPGNN